MSCLLLTEQERKKMVERTERDILSSYARAFSPPRVQQLCDALIGLDRLGACRLASEIDEALGRNATEKVLEHIANSKPLPVGSAITRKRGSKK